MKSKITLRMPYLSIFSLIAWERAYVGMSHVWTPSAILQLLERRLKRGLQLLMRRFESVQGTEAMWTIISSNRWLSRQQVFSDQTPCGFCNSTENTYHRKLETNGKLHASSRGFTSQFFGGMQLLDKWIPMLFSISVVIPVKVIK